MTEYFFADERGQHGPLALDDLRRQIAGRKVLVWHEGLQDWVPASMVRELRDAGQITASTVLPPSPSAHEEWLLMNPALPKMGRIIVAYAVLVPLVWWVFDHGSCAANWTAGGGPTMAGELTMELAFAITHLLLAVGLTAAGIMLRNLVPWAWTACAITFGLSILVSVAYLPAEVLLYMMSSSLPDAPQGTVLGALDVFAGTLEFANLLFKAAAFAWLIARRHELRTLLGMRQDAADATGAGRMH